MILCVQSLKENKNLDEELTHKVSIEIQTLLRLIIKSKCQEHNYVQDCKLCTMRLSTSISVSRKKLRVQSKAELHSCKFTEFNWLRI